MPNTDVEAFAEPTEPLAYWPHTRALAPVFAALTQGRPHHAGLWVGAEGVGKFLWAQKFARQALCLNNAPGDDCMSCAHFAQHPDLLQLGPETDTLKIDAVRGVLQKCALKPLVSSRRVVLIRDAHALTLQAQNALLKTLEEPPPATLFLLLTHLERRLLATIRSRSQVVRFAPLDLASLGAVTAPLALELEKNGLEKTVRTLLEASGGSAARAERLLRHAQDLAQKGQAAAERPLAQVLRGAIKDKLAVAEALGEDEESTADAAQRYAHELAGWIREGNPAQRQKAQTLFGGLEALLAKAQANANRRLLWEEWLLTL